MNKLLQRVVTTVTAFAAVGGVAVLGAAEASAEVDSYYGTYVIVHVAHHGTYVQDITVQSRDGLPGSLRAWVGSYNRSVPNRANYKFVVNKDYPAAKYACGGLSRAGRVIENGCIQLT